MFKSGRLKKINNTVISIPLDPPGEVGQDCIKLIFNINDNCQLQIEGKDLRNNNSPDFSILATRELEKKDDGNLFTQFSLFYSNSHHRCGAFPGEFGVR